MSKQEFLYRLETLLMDLPKDERDDALGYYEQYFEAAGPEREQEVIRELGSPEKVSRMIHSEGGQEEFSAPKKEPCATVDYPWSDWSSVCAASCYRNC